MIFEINSSCPKCGGRLKHRSWVKRIKKQINGNVSQDKLQCFICTECKSTHRHITENFLPYKHYDSSIIFGFVDGTYSFYDLNYEDYPCEITVKRWKSQDLHTLR